MPARIIDGKAVAARVRERIRSEAEVFRAERGRPAGLAVVLVGNDPASAVYVRNKIKGCAETGIRSYSYELPEQAGEAELLELIAVLNADANVDGILVQLPLPKQIDEGKVLAAISPAKDVDGFSALNVGRLLLGEPGGARACTPLGCMELIAETGIPLAGKHAVVVGRSNIVGKPVALMLLAENATVTVCHSKTADLAAYTRQADVLIAAVGKAGLITGDMVKRGAVVIDVGMNRVDGKLCGDCDFDSVVKVAGWVTPVPGGVGPMTITMLLANTLGAARAGRNG